MNKYDFFLSHANSDKLGYVDSLYKAISKLGVNIFYDKKIIDLGDNWKKHILKGIKDSEFAIIVISKTFFKREWTNKELKKFMSRQNNLGQKIILPLLYNVSVEQVIKKYPELKDIHYIKTMEHSTEEMALILAKELIKRMRENSKSIELLDRDDFSLSKAIKNAKKDLFISGSSLACLTDSINELNKKIKLVTMNYDNVNLINQFCKLAGKNTTYDRMKEEDNIFQSLYKAEIGNNPLIEVRKVNFLMPIVYVGVDLGENFDAISDTSYIKVQHYLHEKSGSECPNYKVRPNNELFEIYLEQIKTLWSKGDKYQINIGATP